jgi:hypothetical protein
MRQTLHIFKKDVRHLWFEIVVAILVAVAFAFIGARRAQWLVLPETNRIAAWTMVIFLLPLTWWTLIARAIHDETLPGDRQFWITRPYSWKSLMGAKLLFVLIFVNLPIFLADGVIIHAYGLPLRTEMFGLLWSQVLLDIVFVIPIAVLSTLTAGFVQLLFAILMPCVVGLGVAIAAPEMVLGRFSGGPDWVNHYFAMFVVGVAGSAILIWQYSTRRTITGRSLAIASGILAFLGMALIPWSAAFKVQSWFSNDSVSRSLLHVDFDQDKKWLTRAVTEAGDHVRIELPLKITGLPPDVIVKSEGFSMGLQSSDGTTWKAEQLPLGVASKLGSEFSLRTTMDGRLFRKVKDQETRISGSLYITVFGNRQKVQVPFGDHLVPVARVGVCSASEGATRQSSFLTCTSAFRFPPLLVSYRFMQSTPESAQDVWTATEPRAISYSPFPAQAGINPVSQDFTFSSAPVKVSEARIETAEILAHIKRSFQIDNLRLGDFEVRP